jgi:hypothetical protein
MPEVLKVPFKNISSRVKGDFWAKPERQINAWESTISFFTIILYG